MSDRTTSLRAPDCTYVGCDQPAVAYLSIARDKGDAFCGQHMDEIKAYLERQIAQREAIKSLCRVHQ
jgi:hypothetical protein